MGMTRSESGKLGGIASIEVTKNLALTRRTEYLKNPKLCICCGTILVFEKRKATFCTRSCAAKTNNIGVRKHGQEPGFCLICGKKKRSGSSKTCSRRCYDLLHLREIENGKVLKSVSMKRFLILKHGSGCMDCGITEWQSKPIVVELEHVDGNSENNALDNLKLLCPNCHSQTPTYKARNVGNGRHNRRKRYKEGKSF